MIKSMLFWYVLGSVMGAITFNNIQNVIHPKVECVKVQIKKDTP
jgi:hypothetical protein